MQNPARNAVKAAFIMLFAALCVTESAAARHHRETPEAAPGQFDYYLLSLSWSPAFCLRSPDAAECNGPRRYGFIVHGLWPQNERGWPKHCGGDTRVPDEVVDSVSDLMPARGLVFHEWSAHGTCSGLAPADFFRLVRRARDSLRIPANLAAPTAAVKQSAASVVNAFMLANPRLPDGSVVVTCSGQDEPRLTEVHVCFDRDLGPRACAPDAQHRSCRAAAMIVPPIR